jgi:hypothetical protein
VQAAKSKHLSEENENSFETDSWCGRITSGWASETHSNFPEIEFPTL